MTARRRAGGAAALLLLLAGCTQAAYPAVAGAGCDSGLRQPAVRPRLAHHGIALSLIGPARAGPACVPGPQAAAATRMCRCPVDRDRGLVPGAG
jgi:hypothetical protein